MKKNELDSILKRARPPEISPESLDMFPRRVVANLKRDGRPRFAASPQLPLLRWVCALATCVILGLMIFNHVKRSPSQAVAVSEDVLMNSKLIGGMLSMFPNHIRAIVEDKKGVNLVLSQDENVPDNGPLYVRICGARGCTTLVTFSGQEVQVDGQSVTVLADGLGGIIVTGNQFVWSSTGRGDAGAHPKIEARNLSLAAL